MTHRYRYRAAPRFWRSLKKLPDHQKESTRRAWNIFRENPFDHRLRPHKINALSAVSRRTIYAVEIEADLRVIFYVDGDTIFTVDIGRHDIYRT